MHWFSDLFVGDDNDLSSGYFYPQSVNSVTTDIKSNITKPMQSISSKSFNLHEHKPEDIKLEQINSNEVKTKEVKPMNINDLFKLPENKDKLFIVKCNKGQWEISHNNGYIMWRNVLLTNIFMFLASRIGNFVS